MKKLAGAALAIAAALMPLAGLSSCSAIKSAIQEATERDLERSDYTYTTSEDVLTFSYTVDVTAKADIVTLTLEADTYKSDKATIVNQYSQTKTGIDEGETAEFAFTLSWSDILYSEYVKLTFSGKVTE